MIITAFLQWVETAGASDRAKAAGALARAYLKALPTDEQQRAAVNAMLHLLDDPSPDVRRTLAEILGPSPKAPRPVVLGLAEDQPEIACHIIARSPVLTETDLVELCGRGGRMTRGLIAARPGVGRGAAAAVAEVGDLGEIVVLLENDSAQISRYTMKRIAERFGREAVIRNHLLDRSDVPADVLDLLVAEVSSALAGSQIVQSTLTSARIAHLTREAKDAATMILAASASSFEMPLLIDHLVKGNRLTPAFLMHALCTGKVEFVACSLTALSSVEERRVRSILATGRRHAVRALYESIGLARDIAEVFVEATLLWRELSRQAFLAAGDGICAALMEKFSRSEDAYSPINELLDLVESLRHQEERHLARLFADQAMLAA